MSLLVDEMVGSTNAALADDEVGAEGNVSASVASASDRNNEAKADGRRTVTGPRVRHEG